MDRTPVPADERVAYGTDPNQFFDVFWPVEKPKGLTIYVHGGFWRSRLNLEHASHINRALAGAGYLAVSLEYRRAGETGGGWPVTFQDVAVGFSTARVKYAASGNPVVLGHSAGGHLALLLAANTREMKGVVGLGAVSCLEMAYKENLGAGAVKDFMGGGPEELPEFYAAADPVRHDSHVRRVLVHGTEDDVVPIGIGQAFVKARAMDAGKVSLVEIAGGDHFDPIDPDSKGWAVVLGAVVGLEGG